MNVFNVMIAETRVRTNAGADAREQRRTARRLYSGEIGCHLDDVNRVVSWSRLFRRFIVSLSDSVPEPPATVTWCLLLMSNTAPRSARVTLSTPDAWPSFDSVGPSEESKCMSLLDIATNALILLLPRNS